MDTIRFTLDGRNSQEHTHVWQDTDIATNINGVILETRYCGCGLFEVSLPTDLSADILERFTSPSLFSWGYRLEGNSLG